MGAAAALFLWWFFGRPVPEEAVNTEVYANEPYVSDTGRNVFNDDDGIFDDQLVLATTPDRIVICR